MNPVIYQDPTTKTMYCTDGLRTVASPVTRSYQWYFDDVLQPSLTSNSFTPTFPEAGLTVRCEVTIGASAVSSAPVVVTDWLRQMPDGALLLFDPQDSGVIVEGPVELGSIYPLTTWQNLGSGPDGVGAASWSPGSPLGPLAGHRYVSFDDVDDRFSLGTLTSPSTSRLVIGVFHRTGSGADYLFDSQGTGGSARFIAFRNASGDETFFDGTSRIIDTVSTLEARAFVVECDAVATELRAYRGGVARPVVPYTPRTLGGLASIGSVYDDGTASARFGGQVYFFAVYEGVDALTLRPQVEDYLESRFPMLF